MTVDFSTIERAADAAQVEIRIGYTGRGGRGGEGKLAIVCDGIPYLVEFVAHLVQADPDVIEWVGNVSTDSMGHNTVAYWPNVTVENAPDEDHDEDDYDEEDED